jgi:hypothetical protein
LSRVEISILFTRDFFAQNVCRTSASILVLLIRFLWVNLNAKMTPSGSGGRYEVVRYM